MAPGPQTLNREKVCILSGSYSVRAEASCYSSDPDTTTTHEWFRIPILRSRVADERSAHRTTCWCTLYAHRAESPPHIRHCLSYQKPSASLDAKYLSIPRITSVTTTMVELRLASLARCKVGGRPNTALSTSSRPARPSKTQSLSEVPSKPTRWPRASLWRQTRTGKNRNHASQGSERAAGPIAADCGTTSMFANIARARCATRPSSAGCPARCRGTMATSRAWQVCAQSFLRLVGQANLTRETCLGGDRVRGRSQQAHFACQAGSHHAHFSKPLGCD